MVEESQSRAGDWRPGPSALALFPLESVLLPGMPLGLQVFEPRYLRLLEDVAEADDRFGVVLITRGSEVGGQDQRADVGVVAHIGRRRRIADDRWLVEAQGGERFRVTRWLADDPYPKAEVEPWPHLPGPGADEALQPVRRSFVAFLALLTELGTDTSTVVIDDDPLTAAYQVAALVPISSYDRYRVLAAETVGDAAPALADAVSGVVDILRHRLGRL
ncbi:MAG: LON peptidase substrate-binding domain-containing protein [Acidimicrobiia bacterium]|nr:LON peptidase substrate-binding domain-containing protein [Acidimicrobiia bacterium]